MKETLTRLFTVYSIMHARLAEMLEAVEPVHISDLGPPLYYLRPKGGYSIGHFSITAYWLDAGSLYIVYGCVTAMNG